MLKVDEIVSMIHELYTNSPTLELAWASEKDGIRDVVGEISSELSGQYELGEPLGIGGSGVVLRARNKGLGVDRALKFPRPSPGKQQLLADLLAGETDRLVELSHPYLMRVHAKGTVDVGEFDCPYYVMDLYDSIDDSHVYVANEDLAENDFVQLLERVLEAVAYMHAEGAVHLDIKPSNILVRPGNEPVIADLGFAKVLQDSSGNTFIGGTEGFIHPGALAFIAEASSDPNRLRGVAPRHALSSKWDLFSLGRTILRLLELREEQTARPLSLYTHRYVKLLACRLLDGQNTMDETLLGLSRVAFSEIKYDTADEALQDIRKLTGGFNLETRIPELDQFGPDTIQVSTFSTTRFTPRVKALLDNVEVARLAGFTQLSLLNLVYPTATHTRLKHVMGVFSAMCRYITALYHDPINPLFRQIMTEQDILAALVASLVHDVGHYALAHDLEEAESDIFSHEDRGKELLNDASTGLQEVLEAVHLQSGEPGWGVSVKRVRSILDADVPKMTGTVRDRLIHALIDGPIDADKLDYIIRDSINLGLTYGSVIDVERLMRVLTVVTRQSGNKTYVNIGIHEKGRVTAEAVAFSRYALYGSVYWHHAYRAIKAMLQRITWQYLDLVSEADEKKHTGVKKTVRGELYPALREGRGGAPQTLPLVTVTGSTQLHPGDRAVLEWLAERSGQIGLELARLIQQRRLFKRVLVVSRWENEQLWNSVTTLFATNDWRRKLEFQRMFQEELASAIEPVDSVDAYTTLVIPEARDRFLASIQSKKALVLVDAIRSKPGATSGLEVVKEEDRRRARIDEAPMTSPEQSMLWDNLRTGLHESLGKVRVFCHPDHARFVSALNRDLVEQALDRAWRAV